MLVFVFVFVLLPVPVLCVPVLVRADRSHLLQAALVLPPVVWSARTLTGVDVDDSSGRQRSGTSGPVRPGSSDPASRLKAAARAHTPRAITAVAQPPTGASRPAQVAPAAGDLDRVLTVPNVVTAVRLACVPVFVWLLFGAHEQAAAAVLLAGLGATDWVDGTVARRFAQVSTLGKVLDPIADRVLVGTAVLCAVVDGAVPPWFAGVTIAREALVSGAVVVLASLGAQRIDVLWVGKAGTFALMSAYPAFLMAHGPAGWQHAVGIAAWVVGIGGLALAWVAAASYVPVARRAFAAGRAGRAGGAAP